MDPTQSAGAIACAAAAIACAARRPVELAPVIVFAVAAIEIPWGLRYRLHDAVSGPAVRALAPIADKTHVQWLLLGLAALGALALAFALLRRADGAALAAFALVVLAGVETISLHAIDAILFRRVGPLMLIGWVWIALAGVAILSALARRRRRSQFNLPETHQHL